MIAISTPNEHPRTIQTVQLDGAVYRLRLYWLNRLGGWYVDLLTLAEVPIISGRRISPGGIPFPRGAIGAPRGIFFVTGSDDPYQQSDLGSAVELYYLSEDEYAALLQAAADELEAEFSVRLL